MIHLILCGLHYLIAMLFGLAALLITIPAHLIYAAYRWKNRDLNAHKATSPWTGRRVYHDIAFSSFFVLSLLAGCATYKPTAADYDTDYRRDGIYVLLQDLYIKSETVDSKWHRWLNTPSVDYPRHWVVEANPRNRRFPREDPILPTGARIKFKKLIFKQSFEMGVMIKPIGVVLDGTHSGFPVSLSFVSQGLPNSNATYGKYVNPKYLRLINTSGD